VQYKPGEGEGSTGAREAVVGCSESGSYGARATKTLVEAQPRALAGTTLREVLGNPVLFQSSEMAIL